MKKTHLVSLVLIALALSHMALFGKEDVLQKGKTASSAAKPDFGSMMNQLSQNLMSWNTLDKSSKTQAVDAVIQLYKNRENTAILKSADFYVQRIDEALAGNASMAGTSLINVVRIMAVMEYDFYNGKNKDDLAKEILGEKMAEAVKMRRQFGGGY